MIESWQTVDWEAIESREDLILARMKQLDYCRVTDTLAAINLQNSRKGNKVYFDQHKRLRPIRQQLQQGDLVLLYDNSFQKNWHTKFSDKWRGPYKIIEKAENSTFYRLAELDGTPLAGTTAGNRLKKFYSREIANMLREQDNSSGRTETSKRQETLENEADDGVDEE